MVIVPLTSLPATIFMPLFKESSLKTVWMSASLKSTVIFSGELILPFGEAVSWAKEDTDTDQGINAARINTPIANLNL
jgi:hypothetical protein